MWNHKSFLVFTSVALHSDCFLCIKQLPSMYQQWVYIAFTHHKDQLWLSTNQIREREMEKTGATKKISCRGKMIKITSILAPLNSAPYLCLYLRYSNFSSHEEVYLLFSSQIMWYKLYFLHFNLGLLFLSCFLSCSLPCSIVTDLQHFMNTHTQGCYKVSTSQATEVKEARSNSSQKLNCVIMLRVQA